MKSRISLIGKAIASVLFLVLISFTSGAVPSDSTLIQTEEQGTQAMTAEKKEITGTYEKGLEAMREGSYEAAAEYFEVALEQSPADVNIMTNLARAYIELDNLERASELADKAIETDPSHADSYMIRGRVLYLNDQHEEAVAAYIQCIDIGGPNPFALNNLGLIYIQQEQYEEAIRVLRDAVELRDDIAYIHNNLGIAYENMEDYESAYKAYQEALRVDPGYDRAAANLDRIRDKVEDTAAIGTLEPQ
jgi:tetratricopeptide (TPR) repeat protein